MNPRRCILLTPALAWPLLVVVGYLLGSIPVAVLVARRDRFDPRETGDRNAGFWNVKATVGWRRAVPVFAGDVAKAALAAGVGELVTGSVWGVYAGGAAAMVGHAWPVFARFRGGKSVLAFAGTVAVAAPLAAAGAVVVLIVVAVVTRRFKLGAQIAIGSAPVIEAFVGPAVQVAAIVGLIAFVMLKFAFDRRLTVMRTAAR